jgi:hypothetical protein
MTDLNMHLTWDQNADDADSEVNLRLRNGIGISTMAQFEYSLFIFVHYLGRFTLHWSFIIIDRDTVSFIVSAGLWLTHKLFIILCT